MIAVTGAGGYVGGRLVASLASEGRPVRALVRTPRPWLDGLGGVAQQSIDLTGSVDDLTAALAGCSAVVHLAGANEVVAGSDPDTALADTIVASRHLAAAAAAADVARVVYLSTVHVYGQALAPGATVTEQTVPQPRHAYGIARLASEHVLAAQAGPALTVLRLTNGVGAPIDPSVDRWSLLVPDLCREAVQAGTVTLQSPGQQWRDFVDLRDACAALAAAADGTVTPGTWNLGSGASLRVRKVAELVRDAFERHTGTRPPLHAPNIGIAPGPEAYTVDTSGLAAAGFTPSSTVEAAIDDTVRFCIEHQEQLPHD